MFSLDLFALPIGLALAALAYVLYRRGLLQPKTEFFWPRTSDLVSGSTRLKFYFLKRLLALLSIALLLLAFLDPSLQKPLVNAEQKHTFSPNEGIAIYFVLDQSGSMRQDVSPLIPEERKGISPR